MCQRTPKSPFPVIYELYNTRFNDMLLQPMLDNLTKAVNLTISDITPTWEQSQSYHHQALVHIVCTLTHHVKEFSKYKKDPCLQHKPRSPLPDDLEMIIHTLHIRAIEEASIKGNLLVHVDIIIDQLGQTLLKNPHLLTHAIPIFADLLTLCRICRGHRLQWGDINAWERRDIFTFFLGMGLFHLVMNLIWMINIKYAGLSVYQIGLLNYWFAKLEKVHLSTKKLDFHALLMTLQQLLDGILLYTWKLECGYASFEQFAASKPTPQELLTLAEHIFDQYATPEPELEDDVSDSSDSDYEPDILNRNICLLARDLLYVVELVQAIQDGDFGRIEDIYPDLVHLFCGGGSNNYLTEILHFLYNVKNVWTPEFVLVYSCFLDFTTHSSAGI